MAYDEFLAERIRGFLKSKQVGCEEKKMMGGLCFMVDHKMCLGVVQENLMARVDPDIYVDLLKKEGARPMELSGKPMKGFVFVELKGIDMETDLMDWLNLCLS